MRKVALWSLGLMLFSAASIAVFLAVAGEDFYRWAADRILEGAIDRKVEIDGSVSLDVGWEPTVVVTDLWIGNASWAEGPEILRVKHFEVQVALKPLFSGIVHVPRLVVEGLTLDLETGPDGAVNWQSAKAHREDGKTAEQKDLSYPLLEFISLKDVAITYRDRESGRDTEIILRSLRKERLAGDSSFAVQGEGRLNQSVFRLKGRLGSLEDALAATAPYPFELTLDSSGLVAELKGTVQSLPHAEGFDMALTARAPSIGPVLETLERDLAFQGRLEASARLKGNLESLSVEDFVLELVEQSVQTVQVKGSLSNLSSGKGLELQFTGKLGPDMLRSLHNLPKALDDVVNGVTRLDIAGRTTGDLQSPAFEKLDARLEHRSGAVLALQGRVSLDLSERGPALAGLETTSTLSLPSPALLAQTLGTELPELGTVQATSKLSWKEGWITLSSFEAKAESFGGLRLSAEGRLGKLLKGKLDLDPQLDVSASIKQSRPLVALFAQRPRDARPPFKDSDDGLVVLIQRRLNALGLHPGSADGKMGPHTRSAIETYQVEHSLTVDGKATEELFRHLQRAPGIERAGAPLEADHRASRAPDSVKALPEFGPIMASGRLAGREGTYRLDDLRFTMGEKNTLWIEASGALKTLRPEPEHPLEGLTLKVAFALPSSKAFSQWIPPEAPELKNITGHFDVAGSPEALAISMLRIEAEGPDGLTGDAAGQVGALSLVPSFAVKGLAVDLKVRSPGTEFLSPFVRFRLPPLGALQAKAVLGHRGDLFTLRGVDVSAGPPDKPAFHATGEIGNLLALKQVTVSGNFDVPVASLLGPNIPAEKASLGEIRGQFELSDADGSMGLEKLNAQVINTDLFSISVEGVFDDLVQRAELKFQTSLAVPDPSKLGRRIGFDVGRLGPLSFTGQVSGSDEHFLSEGKARVGQTEFSGTLSGSIKDTRPVMTAKLTSPVFHFADFALVPEADAEKIQTIEKTEQRLFSDEPLPFEALKSFDLDLALVVDQLKGVELDIDKAEGQLTLKGGLLKIDPLRFTFVGGSVVVHLVTDAQGKDPKMSLRLEADDVDLGDLLAQVAIDVPLDGGLDMVLDLQAVGASPRALTSSLEGEWDMAISRGHVRTSLLDLAVLDLVDWMTSDATAKGYSDLNCFILRIDYHEGLGTIQRELLDTTNVLASGTGDINLREETLDVKFVPHAKKARLIGLTTPFSIEGPLASPSVEVGGVTARMIGELVLVPIHLLGSALLPFVHDHGKDPKNPCLIIQAGEPGG